MFYTTDISVTLWILNRNKSERIATVNGETRRYRDRRGEILFMDLRTWGEPYEKKYIQFTEDDIRRAALRFHQWQRTDLGEYCDEPEFCKSVKIADLKDASLVPSKYIEFASRDEKIDYDEKMTALQAELTSLFQQEIDARNEVLNVFRQLGYELNLEQK